MALSNIRESVGFQFDQTYQKLLGGSTVQLPSFRQFAIANVHTLPHSIHENTLQPLPLASSGDHESQLPRRQSLQDTPTTNMKQSQGSVCLALPECDSHANRNCFFCNAANELGTWISVEKGWAHSYCVIWSSEVYTGDDGGLVNVDRALRRAPRMKCTFCSRKGATIGCWTRRCRKSYHYLCARDAGCYIDEEEYAIGCPSHPLQSLAARHRLKSPPLMPPDDTEIAGREDIHSDPEPRPSRASADERAVGKGTDADPFSDDGGSVFSDEDPAVMPKAMSNPRTKSLTMQQESLDSREQCRIAGGEGGITGRSPDRSLTPPLRGQKAHKPELEESLPTLQRPQKPVRVSHPQLHRPAPTPPHKKRRSLNMLICPVGTKTSSRSKTMKPNKSSNAASRRGRYS
eukprot:Rmarinus@m.8753